MGKYLDYLPKTLQEDFIHNNVIPIVGAGFSKNAKIPGNVTMPDWKQLGETVAEYINDYSYTNAIDALSIFESEYSRAKLIELLSKELHINEIKPSKTFEAFCDIFYDVICTTNFDFLLEETLKGMDRPTSVVVSEDKLSVNINNSTKVIKIHGDFNNPSGMVITENDYDLYLNKNKIMSTYLSNLFITKTMLLIGYSFDDYDIRNIWQIIGDRLGRLKRNAYCVMVNASRAEVARFERRNIKVINLPGDKKDYPKILEDFFIEIKDVITSNSHRLLVSNSDKINEELKLPSELSNICYVASPHQNISQIKDYVFPTLKEISLTPIVLDDILYPFDNWLAKSELVIQKSKFALVDVTQDNSNVNWEIKTLEKNNVDIVRISNLKTNNSYALDKNNNVVFYRSLYDESFLNDLVKKFNMLRTENKSDPLQEAERLAEISEYTAAAISAYRYLEEYIRKAKIVDYYEYSFSKSLHTLRNMKILSVDNSKIKENIDLRNKLVHTNTNVFKTSANKAIEFAKQVINDINNYKKD